MFLLAPFETLNKIFIFGGMLYNYSFSDVIYKWDISNGTNDSWFGSIPTKTPRKPFYSFSNNVVVINDTYAYFMGVDDGINNGSVYIFDAINEVFINHNMSYWVKPAKYGCLTTNNTHIFMVSGLAGTEQSQILQQIDITHRTLPIDVGLSIELRTSAQYCYLNEDILYIFNGASGSPPQYPYHAIWAYNISSFDYEEIGSNLVSAYAGSTSYHHPYIYLIGGQSLYSMSDIVEIFDIENQMIAGRYRMLKNVSNHGSIIINNTLYIFGGADLYAGIISTVQVCGLPIIQKDVKDKPDYFYLLVGTSAGSVVIVILICVCYRNYRRRSAARDDELLVDTEQVLGK